ncbi:MAG: UDP-N-acetylglucosamine 1-carboxyvinyltransferase [Candidatus Omnitrophica bacterium]|nr:UDP-N-acetylglucosamine 1-carboxyvinyltransferase [Candidatus Omnitrophota bacterium]
MAQRLIYDENTKIIVKKSRLEGKVSLSGAKNSALRLLAASILTDDDVNIQNYPAGLLDAQIHVEMLKQLGKTCDVTNDTITIKYGEDLKEELHWDGPCIRNTLLIFGALLTRKKRAKVPLPGGCSLGERKYDLHIMLLERLGAKIWEEDGYLCGEAPKGLVGSEVTLPIRSTGATENTILAASLAKGTTILWGPHIRPEIIELISFLRTMGANIEVYGQESIYIHGVKELSGTRYRVMPDNMEAITYLIGAVITNGDIEIENFPYKDLEVPLIHLRESGARFYCGEDTLIVRGGNCFPVDISTGPYPGINSDMQPLFAVYGLCANGNSHITDLRFPKRFKYTEELKKLNAKFVVKDNLLIVQGGSQLHGNTVTSLDLRCGAALMLAGLVSTGTTTINSAHQIIRGYENIDIKMQKVGGNVFFEDKTVK